MAEEKTRYESDSMGSVELPDGSYWGSQTQRAALNFDVSPQRIPIPMLAALAQLKKSAAAANLQLGLLDRRIADAIIAGAGEVLEGKMNDQFPVDVFQTGSGTSWNMNMNEVIANIANEILGGKKGAKSPVHPNDHVNKGQSSNDVIPSAISISTRLEAEKLKVALEGLRDSFTRKAGEFAGIVKLGRTHLQDAVPVTLGNEFSSFSEQMKKGAGRVAACFGNLEELALGGTAVGTGLNTHPDFAKMAIANISKVLKVQFRPAANYFESLAARDAQLELMGAVNTIAVGLMKIAQDLRLLSSGPRAALGEIKLPSLQPGSSIMPGKVNPVIPEMILQVAAHVMGKHLSVTVACQNAPLQLNIMQPLIAYETLSALDLLVRAIDVFQTSCVEGITADAVRCRSLIDLSLALVTPLALKIGYDEAAKIAYRAYDEHKTVKQIVIEGGILTEAEADEVLSPENMVGHAVASATTHEVKRKAEPNMEKK